MNMEAGGARCPFGPCRMYVGLELPTYLEPKGSNAFSEKGNTSCRSLSATDNVGLLRVRQVHEWEASETLLGAVLCPGTAAAVSSQVHVPKRQLCS